ncbi:MAG: rubrerythrin family protein [Bacillota bacterium]|nr:MAG: rubrerythrin family protein [Bacillota bacterium]
MKSSKTLINLARAFAGESQAGLRYQMIAELCKQQGYNTLETELKTIAKNEVAHAKNYYNLLTEQNGTAKNIEICAGYPFEKFTIEDGLKFSMEAEHEEAEKIYPEFAKIAREEGFEDIAKKFELTAKVERKHELTFKFLYENFKNGTLFKNNEPTFWECTECGHVEARKEAWNMCPLCNATQGFVKLKLN